MDCSVQSINVANLEYIFPQLLKKVKKLNIFIIPFHSNFIRYQKWCVVIQVWDITPLPMWHQVYMVTQLSTVVILGTITHLATWSEPVKLQEHGVVFHQTVLVRLACMVMCLCWFYWPLGAPNISKILPTFEIILHCKNNMPTSLKIYYTWKR